jgi:hypothetical protein
MNFSDVSIFAIILLIITSMIQLNTSRWEYGVLALSLQYVGVFLLTGISWPFGLASIKLISGLITCVILMLSLSNTKIGFEISQLHSFTFILFSALLIIFTVSSIAPLALQWIPGIDFYQAWGGLLLVGIGILHLGFKAGTFQGILSLITFLSGFEILYARVESSSLVAGLLAFIHLGIAIVGVNFLSLYSQESNQ